jgi:V8-like Glu-specific endopeptidase
MSVKRRINDNRHEVSRSVPFVQKAPALVPEAARLRDPDLSQGVPFLARNDIDGLILETTVDRANYLPAHWLMTGAARARAILKISTSGRNFKGEDSQWSGTGFLVSDNILLTNYHVLNSSNVARKAVAIFDYEQQPDGTEPTTKSFSLNPERLFIASPVALGEGQKGLDFAFVWVEQAPGGTYGSIPLGASNDEVVVNDFANIIQHPGGGYKVIAVQENLIVDIFEQVVRYVTDTSPGSSGGCVFDNAWRPVALHHASAQARGNARTIENEGIRFSGIKAELEVMLTGGNEAAREVLALFSA